MKTYTIILIVILGIGGIVFWFSKNNKVTPTPETLKSYTNGAYGYSLTYPERLEKREYGNENVVFGTTTGEFMDGVAEVRVETLEGKSGETFEQTLTKRMMDLCAADGPNRTFSCTEAESIQPFTTKSGLTGIAFYLNGELKDLSTGKIQLISKGPYFAIALKSGATGSRTLVIHPPLNKSAPESDSVTIRNIAQSVILTSVDTQNSELEAYVRDNISKLSSEKEVLGGKFYITKFEAHGGVGTVEYEDGHNAFIADFKYDSDENGKISVTDFKIRK